MLEVELNVEPDVASALEEVGGLTAVTAHCVEGRLDFAVAVEFAFGSISITVAANPDDDSVEVRKGARPLGQDEVPLDLTQQAPWVEAIGCTPMWAWSLVNSRGYHDAVQIEFASNGSSRVTVQLMVIASAFKVARLRFEDHIATSPTGAILRS